MLTHTSIRFMSIARAGWGRGRKVETFPLVSIGIPTYNRPEGLRRTLNCICGQTYKNLEIIVSDNCSPDQAVKELSREFVDSDSRVSYYRQEESIGVSGNFRFVLQKSQGEYFMWAADDDEWAPDFISQCMEVLQKSDAVSVMSHFDVSYRFENRKETVKAPSLSIEKSAAQNALEFLRCMTPSLFYGLHKREKIGFFLTDEFFDFYDCYFIFRLILMGPVAVIEPCLYTAGIDQSSYQIKPMKAKRFLSLEYMPFLAHSVRQVILSTLRLHEKVIVTLKLMYVVVSIFFFYEVKGRLK